MEVSEFVVGWSVLGRGNSSVLVCKRCLRDDEAFDADLFGAADWAVQAGLAVAPAAASEVLAEHPEAQHDCRRCGRALNDSL